jgi:hypothetical protein
MRIPQHLRLGSAIVLLGTATPGAALTTTTILQSALSPDCLEYRVVGICYWLYCSSSGCRVRTSVKVRHYVPDAVVSSYSNTGDNPWVEVRAMSLPNPTAQAGGDGTTNQDHENNLAKFKNADVIGHPGAKLFSQFAAGCCRPGRCRWWDGRRSARWYRICAPPRRARWRHPPPARCRRQH